MTPDALGTAIRRRYNAIGDSFWADDEIYQLIYDAMLELARETQCIERIYSTPTVISTQAYDFPSNSMAIRRATFEGIKLRPITMRDDDALTGFNQTTIGTGIPRYYWIWNKAIYLRPIPSEVGTLKLWTFNYPSTVTATSSLEIPEEFQMKLIDFALKQMAAKDSNFNGAKYYGEEWEKDKVDIRAWMKKMKRTDGMAVVQDENLLVDYYLGAI